MLNVVLQDGLKEYLKQHHHNDISLSITHNDYTTGNIFTINPHIRFKTPKHLDQFDSYLIDGISVYVDKEIEAYDDTLVFVEESILGVHRCHVKGIKLDQIN